MASSCEVAFGCKDILEHIWKAADTASQRVLFATFKQLRALPTVTSSITDWVVGQGAAVAVAELEQQWPKASGVHLQRVCIMPGGRPWGDVLMPVLAGSATRLRITALFSGVTTLKLQEDATLVSTIVRHSSSFECGWMPCCLACDGQLVNVPKVDATT